MVTADPPTPLLSLRGIVKHFPGAKALDGVDLDVVPGEVHCLLGQNGAGKSTLIKVLAGAHQPGAGTVTIGGETVVIPNPVAALRLGIATMYQELDVVDGLSVAENVFLGHELAVAGFSQRREATRRTREILARLGHSEISPHREVGRLSAAGKQIVSMARALSHDARVIVMDEPSAVLDSEEVANLFHLVREVTAAGIAVIYISHRLEEIREIGDRITVLKDGRTVARNLAVSETPTADLIRLMTGRTVDNVFPVGPGVPDDAEVVLDVDGLALAGTFSDVSLQVRAGEIVGLAGLVGSGRSEILETIYGARKASAGTVTVGGRRLRRGSVSAAVDAGIGLAPEERKSQASAARRAGVPQRHPVQLRPVRPPRRARREAGAGRRLQQSEALHLRPAGVDPRRPDAVRRQPAEGRARPLAGARLPRAAARRAHPRRRRRRPRRDLRPDPAARRRRRRRRRGLQRDPRGARSRRPGAGHLRRTGGPPGRRPPRSTSTACSTSSWKEASRERAEGFGGEGHPRRRGSVAAPRRTGPAVGCSSGSVGRNLGLVVALVLLCIVGIITGGERFASIDNILTVLRFASVIGVLAVGMTFVITAGGIDLSVGSVLGLASVWASTVATQTMAGDSTGS